MTTVAYAGFELRRTFRNKRFFIFSMIFPCVMFYFIAGSAGADDMLAGISVREYFMASMASWGTMMAAVSIGARIASERAVGWNRQLRLTPLPPRSYLITKIATGYLTAIASMILLFAAGLTLDVRLDADVWLQMTGLILIGTIPFALLGVLIGHLAASDQVGPLMGGLVSLFAFLGGAWFDISDSTLGDISKFIPSYWLVQAGRGSVLGQGWSAQGWTVVAVWAVALGVLATWAYRRDTQRS